MQQKDYMHQMINFNQKLFDSAFETAVKFQDHVEKINSTLMDKADWLPGESRKIYDNCVQAYKSARSNFKSYVEEGYKESQKLIK
jgi:hypothetical protein